MSAPRFKCATIGCPNTADVVISYRYRGADDVDADLVCRPCAGGYSHRPILVDFKITDIAPSR